MIEDASSHRWAANEDQLNTALTKISTNWDRLHNPLSKERTNEGGSKSTEAPTPVPVAILSLRRQVDERLAALVRAIRSENDLETRPTTANTHDVIHFLHRWANWLSAQDWINEPKALPELTHLANRCEDLALGYTTARYQVGTCPDCTARLYALIRTNSGDPKPSKLRCDGDPKHEWDETTWPALGDRLSGRQEANIADAYRRLATRMSIQSGH